MSNDFTALARKWAVEGIEGPQIIMVQQSELGPGVSLIEIVTVKGIIICIRHLPPDVEPGTPVPFTPFFLGGAIGGLSGTGGLYQRLGKRLGGVRIHYRQPANLEECLIDVLSAFHLLAREGLERTVLVGHSFGGGVALGAGVLLGPATRGVVTLATQLPGSELAPRLAGTPVLLFHGTADTILPDTCSRNVYARLEEPKELVLIPNEGHLLDKSVDMLDERIGEFIQQASER
jgi:alpha-beta hydrolase superfamily lysophospholipase